MPSVISISKCEYIEGVANGCSCNKFGSEYLQLLESMNNGWRLLEMDLGLVTRVMITVFVIWLLAMATY